MVPQLCPPTPPAHALPCNRRKAEEGGMMLGELPLPAGGAGLCGHAGQPEGSRGAVLLLGPGCSPRPQPLPPQPRLTCRVGPQLEGFSPAPYPYGTAPAREHTAQPSAFPHLSIFSLLHVLLIAPYFPFDLSFFQTC